MAADVTSLFRVLNGYNNNNNKDDRSVVNESVVVAGKSSSSSPSSVALFTRDLLGVGVEGSSATGFGSSDDSQELDLDLQVPTGWEKRLDLKSGKVYLQRCNSMNSPSSSSDQNQKLTNQTVSKLQDLNFPPSPSKITLNLFDESNLELKLLSSSSSSTPSSSSGKLYQSVCTLDKVKSALERAEKEPIRKRSTLWKSSPLSPEYSSSSSSIKEIQDDETEENGILIPPSPVAAGCPGCLSYVLIMKNNPKCPRCNSLVPLPMSKKPRIDLNISI